MADITLLATADWDHPLWTNKQHVACQLAERGHRVLYVESIGLRPPRPGAADRSRLIRRLRHGLQGPRRVRPNLWVWSPLVLPAASSPWGLRLNRLVLRLGLAACRGLLRLRRDWLWTYNPLTLQLFDTSRHGLLIYHCVDAIQEQPGMPARTIDLWEERLSRAADAVFVTSPQLLERHRRFNPACRFYGNVADADHFGRALEASLPEPPELAVLPRPRLGFIGAISGYKLDLPLLAALARQQPEWTLVLIGPVGEGDPETDVSELKGLANVVFAGPQPYRALPAWLKGMDVALLPVRRNAYTRAMFPMKFFEYLAAGVPVVATAIETLAPHADVARLSPPDPASFAAAIRRCLDGDVPPLDRRLAVAGAHTYRTRTGAMLADVARLTGTAA
ncbi:glycosyltransferase family 1 protein [Synechococcus sp. RSCCF101]|uniref:glycosyltransferase n=1 Tax=Synechococcus sp. RSCCF101 TaxID=2511069 RepID=UPI00124550D0|nr:glycosyltransferase [Synechococcus sp. RSCCF101]QEY32440.1 glycosyltransferase family 1 protein [Synechococcus sp. RSCCF101]